MSEIKLKQCLFCGGKVNTVYGYYDCNEWGVHCKDCWTYFGFDLDDSQSEEEAIKAYNTQRPVERVLRRLERRIGRGRNKSWSAGIEKAIEIIKEELCDEQMDDNK